jgi:hypothetical protein
MNIKETFRILREPKKAQGPRKRRRRGGGEEEVQSCKYRIQ